MSVSTSHSDLGYIPALSHQQKNIVSRWLDWAADQDKENHIGWVGFSVMIMTGVFFPATMTAILMNGASFGLIIVAMVSLVLVVVSNLAALPTKYTIPFLFLAVLMDIVVIVLSFFVVV